MNREKWQDPRVDFVKLAAKLAEETGETVQEILNSDEEGHTKITTLKRIEEEAAHVEFLANVIKMRAKSQRRRIKRGQS